MVEILIRDINGNPSVISLKWSEICEFINNCTPMLSDEEILLITCNGTCIYSQLGNDPITWEDVSGFFA